MTIDALIDDGYLETKTDQDGDESLVTLKEVKSRYK
jgi:hypothetical protein